jgi:ABC-type glutathione transport system ATPase component
MQGGLNMPSTYIDPHNSATKPAPDNLVKDGPPVTIGEMAPIATVRKPQKQPSRHVSNLNSLSAGNKAYFGWSDVSFKLSAKAVGNSKKDPRILKGLKGTAVPGEVVAIMGASGCGKTSLLNVLSGRIVSMNGHEVSGNFTVNGIPVKPQNMGSKVAFVTQEDTLCPTATPREALEFSARLRLPPSVTAEERTRMVNEAIEVLRLEKCADSMIGDEMIKGISGGEKR